MTSPKMSYNPVILPTNVVPMHYDLTLEPQFPTSRFTGTVKIDLNIVEESTSITLHTLEIEIASASIWVAIEGLAPISRISSNSTTQTTTFDFDKPLAKGASPTLIIEYKGLLNENRAGFYKVVYQKSDGTQGNIAVSCMESIYARRVFPCFDEPLLKAKFTITLKAPSSFTCLSNMDVDHKCPGEGNTVTFQKSPPMSTYLVAFVIGDFQYIEHNDGTPRVRVYTPSAHATTKAGSNKSLLSALELLSKTIRFFEDKLGIPFLLSKLDLVAIPALLGKRAIAMESWGLIACDMQVVLRLTEANKHIIQRAAAHQWWGNSVTMGDWSKLWFKEAFATWLAHLCRSKCWEDFREALFQDSSCDSYPLETSKWHLMPLERQSPMYAKAYGVVCMISNYIGSPLLLECLGQFLKTDANRNTQASDLWKVLEAASGKQVGRFVKIWVENTGRPLITVTGLEGNSIRIRQEPFLQSEGDPVLYPIPLGFCSSTSNGEQEVLWEREKTFDVLNVDIFKLNRDYLGVYYTVYTLGILQKLGEAVKDGKLSIEDRAGLLLEVRVLAKAGIYKTSTVLRLMELFKEEEELLVWVSIFEVLRSITEAWMREEQIIKTHLNLFKLDLVRDMAHKIGWEFKEGEEDHQQQLKKLLFKNAGLAGDEEVITAASNMFQEYVAGDNNAIAPKILGSVFLIVLEHGGSKENEKLLERYEKDIWPGSDFILYRLDQSKDPKLIISRVGLGQGLPTVARRSRDHPEGIRATYLNMMKYWDELEQCAPTERIIRLISVCTLGIDESGLKKVQEFFGNKDTRDFDQDLKKIYAEIRDRISWEKRDKEDVVAWAKQREEALSVKTGGGKHYGESCDMESNVVATSGV